MTLFDLVDLDKIWTVNFVTKKIVWGIGETGRGTGLEVIRTSKLKKKNKKTIIIEYDGS